MNQNDRTNPNHKIETVFIGEFQEFRGPALSPDHPEVQGRERRGRPNYGYLSEEIVAPVENETD